MNRGSRPRSRAWRWLGLIPALGALALSSLPASAESGTSNPTSQWTMFGQNLSNTASASQETAISTSNVSTLAPKWTFTTHGDVSARAAVLNGVAYFPDWGGYLYAVNANSGALIWQTQLVNYFTAANFGGTLPAKVVSRASPAITGNTLYLGTQKGAYLLSINAKSGVLNWKSQLDAHPLAILTASPSVYNNAVYMGVASLEEGASADPSYPCCSFRGSAVAVNATTGKILWKTYTAPLGYTGDSVWGSNSVIDASRKMMYVGTGNNYSTPTAPAFTSCMSQTGATEEGCLSPLDYVDSVLALDMTTGQVKWSRRLATADDWTVACFFFPPGGNNCPTGAGPDYDFGSAPNEFTIQTANGPKTVIGAGQKSGVYSAFDATTGKPLWATQVGPGSSLGGMEWGSATDGRQIYVAIGNFYGIPYGPTNSWYGGSYAALNPATGQINWQVADPHGAVDLGPLAVANGVVYAPSMAGGSADTNMFALDAATGATKWQYAAGGSVIAGADVVNGVVYWGSGYSNLGIPGYTPNNKFYAFSLGGQ